jgi:hypothetical protein
MVNSPGVSSDGPYCLSLLDGMINNSLDWLGNSLEGLVE